MRQRSLRPALLLAAALFLLSGRVLSHAQVAGTPVVRTVDGGATEVLQSIVIPPVAGAPFTLTLETEWARPFGTTGGTMTVVNRRHIARDATGRIYQERWLLIPKGSKIASRMNLIQITDPNAHTLYECFTENKRCELINFTRAPETMYKPSLASSGPLPGGEGTRTSEELGRSDIAGLEATGYREITTVNPGVFGNDQPMVSTREFWYSPQLQISLKSLIDGPRTGRQQFHVTEVSPTDPDPRFFNLPEGYTVVDLRHLEPAKP